MEQNPLSPPITPAIPLTVQPQMSQVMPPIQPSQPKSRIGIIIAAAVIITLLGVATAGAFYFKVWPFSGGLVDKKTAFKNLFTKVEDISSASYEMNLEFKGVEREVGAKPLKLTFPEIEQQKAVLQRDGDRFRDIKIIFTALNNDYRGKSKYPKALAGLPDLTGTSINNYTYSSTDSDFSLMVAFESDKAIDEIKRQEKYNPVTISGKSVTFSKATGVPYYYLNQQPAQPQWIALLDQQDYLYQSMPGDTKAKIKFGGTAERSKDKQVDAEFHAAFDLSLGDLSFALDGDLLKKGEIFYGRINKMPSLFADVSVFKQKWVKITKDDFSGWGYFEVDTVGDPKKDLSVTVLDQMKLALTIANEEQVLNVDFNLPDEKIENKNYYVYQISFQPEKVAKWYERLEKELREKYGDMAIVKLDKDTLSLLQSDSFKEYMKYINDNNRWKIVVDPRSGFPVRFDTWSRLVPPDSATKLAKRQFELSGSLKLTNINQPIVVTEPQESITVEDVMISFMGITKEEYRFQQQESRISLVRSALRSFKSYTGAYPTTLDQLLLKRSEVTKVADNQPPRSVLVGDRELTYPDFSSGTSDPDSPFVKSIPQDIFANKPFDYQLVGADYALKYQMVLPARRMDADPKSYNSIGVQVLDYINGQNTANEKNISTEIVAATKIDSDKDGLPDFVEQYYKSDPKKKDTDGDGYPDGEEVKNGFDPSGPGELDYSDRWSNNNLVSFDNFEDGRAKATIAAVKGSLSAVVPAILICEDSKGVVTYDGTNACDGSTKPVVNTSICGTMNELGSWPNLESDGFLYTKCFTSKDGNTSYSATNGQCTIDCSAANGCVSVGTC